MRFKREEQYGFIFCGGGLTISFLILAYIDRWTPRMLTDIGLAVMGWLFFVLGIGIRRESKGKPSTSEYAGRPGFR